MDLLTGMFVLLVLGVPVVRYFVWRARWDELKQRIGGLDARVGQLSADLKVLKAERRGASGSVPIVPRVVEAPPVAEPAPKPVVAAAYEPPARPEPVATDEPVMDAPPTAPEEPETVTVEYPADADGAEVVPPQFAAAFAREAESVAEPRRPEPTLFGWLRERIEKMGGGAELEALIGGNWLNKIGIGALVIGVALFIRYALVTIGPLGKVGLGVALGAALLGGGLMLEKRARYALFARPLIGGGWAILYFTAYAAHNFPAARVIEDPVLGLGALIAVAAGMIVHSLRFRAEMVTGVAYVLAFVAIDISPLGIYSLIAAALLAMSLVVLFWRYGWYRAVIGAVVATYGTHYLWMQGAPPVYPVPPAAFWVAEGILLLYWVTFAVTDFLRRPANEDERRLQSITTLGNALAFLVISWNLMGAAYPDGLHVFSALIAVAALAMSALAAVRDRHEAYRLYGLIAGGAAMVATNIAIARSPFSGEWLAITWGVLAAAIIAIGLWRREFAFRIEGYVVGAFAGLAACIVGIYDAVRPEFPASEMEAFGVATVIGIAAALTVGEWVLARFADRLKPREIRVGTVAGYAAALLVGLLVFRHVDGAYLGVVWLAIGTVALEAGIRAGHLHTRLRAYALMAAGFFAVVAFNTHLIAPPWDTLPVPERWFAFIGAAIVAFSATWRVATSAARVSAEEVKAAPLGIYIGALILAIAAWNELPVAGVPLAWGVVSLALFVVGRRTNGAGSRAAAYILALAAWLHLFATDLYAATTMLGPVSTRVLAVVPVAALLLYFRHTIVRMAVRDPLERALPYVFALGASIAIAELLRIEIGNAHVVIGWAVAAVALVVAGVKLRAADYRFLGYTFALLSFARCWTTSFALYGDWLGMPERIATTAPVIAALFVLGLIWRRERTEIAAASGLPPQLVWVDTNAAQISGGLGIALTALLLYYSVAGNVLTIAWAIEGLVVTAAGFAFRERTLRLGGLTMIVLGLVKLVAVDLAGADTIVRIFSFIVLGAILIGISFIYTRYREVVRTYL